MDKYISTSHNRKTEWQSLVDSYNGVAKTLETWWTKLEAGQNDLNRRKDALAEANGGAEVSGSDVLDINAGGQIFSVKRSTLRQIKGSQLDALFSGRWEKKLHRDSKGHIFLDVNPACFKSILDYLNERKIETRDSPPSFPHVVGLENQGILSSLMTAFGLHREMLIESNIFMDIDQVRPLLGFLKEDDLDTGLKLLYRGSRDGMDVDSFHGKCDCQGPTVTVVKSSGGFIFGGFSDLPWSGNSGYSRSEKSFLFGIICKGGNQPVKLRLNDPTYAICRASSRGPTFGGGNDLTVIGSNYTEPGFSYALPTGYEANRYYFTGTKALTPVEVEVFQVVQTQSARVTSQPVIDDSLEELCFDAFPEGLRKSFEAEKLAICDANRELLFLQEEFNKERATVDALCPRNPKDIAHFNVSGRNVAVKHSTLGQYPDSVLYKNFEGGTTSRPSNWKAQEVVTWSKTINGLSQDISSNFCDITGIELLAMNRDDVKDLGITRPGTVALVTQAIEKLREEDDRKNAMLIEHSDYCFEKIIDHMRLKAMGDLGISSPAPPEIREPDRKRFKKIVDHYFPNEGTAAEFLGPPDIA